MILVQAIVPGAGSAQTHVTTQECLHGYQIQF